MAISAQCPDCRVRMSVKKKVCSCGCDMDAAKKAQKVRYWIDFFLPSGKRRHEPVGTSIRDAQDTLGKRRAQRRENKIFELTPSKMTFKDLAKWYLNLEKVKAMASYRIGSRQYFVNKFLDVYGDRPIMTIKPVDLEDLQFRRKREGMADQTVDYELTVIKAMLNKAADNDLISSDALKPFKRVKKLLKKGANVRDRILSRQEFDTLMDRAPAHIRLLLALGYYTGMRKGETLGLTWDKVDLSGRVIRLEASDTKDREAREIPISEALLRELESVPRGLHDNHVVLYQGHGIVTFQIALKILCDECGIAYGRKVQGGFTFHDLRHTFNTNMRRAGVAESVVMAITGHATREMFDRYNTVTLEDTREAVDRLEAWEKAENCNQNVNAGAEN